MKQNKIYLYLIVGLILLSGILHVFLLNSFNTWLDEQYTLLTLQNTPAQIYRIILEEDAQPPFYYFSLYLWFSIFGNSILSGKVYSMLGLLSIGLLGLFPVKRLFGNKVAFLFTAAALFLPYSFYIGTEIRMYTWATFFATGILIYTFAVLKTHKRSDWFFLALFTILGIYTHYYVILTALAAFGILFFEQLFSSFKEQRRAFWITSGLIALAYLPGLFILAIQFQHAQADFWITMRHTHQSVRVFYSYFFKNPPLNHFITASMLLCWLTLIGYTVYILATRQIKQNRFFLYTFLIFLTPLCIGFATSYLLRPLLIWKYLIPSMGAFSLLLALTFATFKRPYWLLLLLLLSVESVFSFYISYQKNHSTALFNTIEFIKKNVPKSQTIIATTLQNYFILELYLPDFSKLLTPRSDQTPFLKERIHPLSPETKHLLEKGFFIFSYGPMCINKAPIFHDTYFYSQYYCLYGYRVKQ